MKELNDEQKKAIEEIENLLDKVGLNDVVLVQQIGAPRPHRPN